MPSPFPGMDPYLEGSEWQSVHYQLSAEIARQLAPKVAPKYIVRPTRRFVTEMPEEVTVGVGAVLPDVSVTHPAYAEAVGPSPVLIAEAPLQLETVMAERVPHVTVEIRDVAERDLVTAIEVLSPTNKRGVGYWEYVDKRTQILGSPVQLIEIDLLRTGRRVPMRDPLPAAPYFVFVSRSEQRPMIEVWPVTLNMRLPTVPVPLLAGDADVPLDLQLALDTVYDTLRYDLSIDYTHPPEVPLGGNAAQWVADVLGGRRLS